MKILKQKISKQIIIVLLILIMLFDIFQPISNAAEGDGGDLFEPLVHFLAGVADLGIELLQAFLCDNAKIVDSGFAIYIRTSNNFC